MLRADSVVGSRARNEVAHGIIGLFCRTEAVEMSTQVPGANRLLRGVCRKNEHCTTLIDLSRSQDRRREMGNIWCIREVLGLQTEPVSLFVYPLLFAGKRAVQEIAGVELNTRFGCPHFENPAGFGFENTGGRREKLRR